MCGEIDEEDRFQGDLYQRFLVHSRRLLEHRSAAPGSPAFYLDTLFADVLGRCAADGQTLGASEAYDRMAMQSLVLARLAGFLAGHVALNEDPLRKLIEAAMLGYSEADMPARPTAHAHHHAEEPDHHGHDHGH